VNIFIKIKCEECGKMKKTFKIDEYVCA